MKDRIRYKINQNTAFKLYDTLILPHITYCNIIWGKACKTHTLNIARLQKRALRLCLERKSPNSDSLFKKSNRLSLDDLNKLQVAKIISQYFNNIHTLPGEIASLFQKISNIHHYHTRSLDNHCLFNQYGRLNVRKNSLKVYAPILWNTIPIYLREINSICLFKRKYKSFLLESV